MDRTASIELPALPLQLLLQRHPDWAAHPAAVVDRDHPNGTLLWINRQAQQARIQTGMRFATALALSAELRAAEVAEAEITRALQGLTRLLRHYSPHVEPVRAEPGLFSVDASGFERLHGPLDRWAQGLAAALRDQGFQASLVVGFRRIATQLIAKSHRGLLVLEHPDQERAALHAAPLARLGIAPKTRDALHKLGIATLGDFLALPAEGVRRRYGEAAYDLHRQASGALDIPLQPEPPCAPLVGQVELEQGETDTGRLLYGIAQLLDPLLERLAERGQRLDALQLDLQFARLGSHQEHLRPAAPTTDRRQLLELIALRIGAARLPDAVTAVRLRVQAAVAERRQLELLATRPRRDLDAANRALARVRAVLGEHAVVHASLQAAHLPERQCLWAPLQQLAPAQPQPRQPPRLVRRLYQPPILLPPRPRHEPDGWMLHRLEQGPVVRVTGPYIIAGGWWVRPVHREYHFAETQQGELLWLFYDRLRRRWLLHGRVE